MNSTRNTNTDLLPFPVILAASGGVIDAINAVPYCCAERIGLPICETR